MTIFGDLQSPACPNVEIKWQILINSQKLYLLELLRQICPQAHVAMESHHADNDPFADPTIVEDQLNFVGESTLHVGRNASLTLGTDCLIVLGIYAFRDHKRRRKTN